MRIKGRSVQLFLPVFLKYRSPANTVSKTSTNTIYNILTTYAQLGIKNERKKISVSDIVKKSGYSRTTFYTYFADVQEIVDMLEDMISYHMYTNADVYFSCFLGALSPKEEAEVLSAIDNFSDYIYALMLHSPGYEERYHELFVKSFEKAIHFKQISTETQAIMLNAVYASMVHLISEHLKGNETVTYRAAMDAVKIIMQSIVKQDVSDS